MKREPVEWRWGRVAVRPLPEHRPLPIPVSVGLFLVAVLIVLLGMR
jgi:hypothetical protein